MVGRRNSTGKAYGVKLVRCSREEARDGEAAGLLPRGTWQSELLSGYCHQRDSWHRYVPNGECVAAVKHATMKTSKPTDSSVGSRTCKVALRLALLRGISVSSPSLEGGKHAASLCLLQPPWDGEVASVATLTVSQHEKWRQDIEKYWVGVYCVSPFSPPGWPWNSNFSE